MWRCKWTELRIKELGLQALKYDREIAAQNQRKNLALEQLTLEGCNSRSFPYNFHSHRKKALKRRKRKRVEVTTDTKSYMSNHNFFSYCGTTFFFYSSHLCLLVTFSFNRTLSLSLSHVTWFSGI